MKKIYLLLIYLLFYAISLNAQDTQVGEYIDFPTTEIIINSGLTVDNNPEWKKSLNFNWKFQLGDFVFNEVIPIDDSGWRDVNLPHDWSIEGE